MSLEFKEHIGIDLYYYDDDIKIDGFAAMPEWAENYKVLLSRNVDPDQRLAAFLHEMTHIFNHDFEKTDVKKIEADCKEQLKRALKLLIAEN